MYVGYLHAEFEKTLEIVGLSWWRLSGHLFGVSGNAVVLSVSTNSPILALMSHFLLSVSLRHTSRSFQISSPAKSNLSNVSLYSNQGISFQTLCFMLLWYIHNAKKHHFQIFERGYSLSRGFFDDASWFQQQTMLSSSDISTFGRFSYDFVLSCLFHTDDSTFLSVKIALCCIWKSLETSYFVQISSPQPH